MLHCLSAKLSTIVKSLCIARVLRHFVLIPHEICVVPFGHWKIAPDRNDISIANRESIVKSLTHACASFHSFKHAIYPSKNAPCTNTSFKSCRCQLNCIIVESILSQKACKHAFRHASPQAHLLVALLLQMRWLGSQARCWS